MLDGFELADDLLRGVTDSFHSGVPGPVWPDEDSHSAWTDSGSHVIVMLAQELDQDLTLSRSLASSWVLIWV